jgi:hypothetical protein
MWDPKTSGIDNEAMQRFIEEQIYSLPGTECHREVFSILLTGSRALGMHTPTSDVDVDVVCPESVYESVHRASLAAGIVKAELSFFCIVPNEDGTSYFGKELGNSHFSITPLETVGRQLREYEDVPLWIWTNAKAVVDPNGQFQRLVDGFTGYPPNVLIRKIKYHWLLSWYWAIETYPHHHSSEDELLAAATSLINATNELLKFFFLVEGKPFPYAEKLMRFAPLTKLGSQFCPHLQRIVDLATGREQPQSDPWDRLDSAFAMLASSDVSPAARQIQEACAEAMLDAGVNAKWVEADFDNIDELLLGHLGPPP